MSDYYNHTAEEIISTQPDACVKCGVRGWTHFCADGVIGPLGSWTFGPDTRVLQPVSPDEQLALAIDRRRVIFESDLDMLRHAASYEQESVPNEKMWREQLAKTYPSLTALMLVLSRRPIQVDMRPEVYDFLLQALSNAKTAFQPNMAFSMQSARVTAAGVSLVIDYGLEPGFVRAHERMSVPPFRQSLMVAVGTFDTSELDQPTTFYSRGAFATPDLSNNNP